MAAKFAALFSAVLVVSSFLFLIRAGVLEDSPSHAIVRVEAKHPVKVPVPLLLTASVDGRITALKPDTGSIQWTTYLGGAAISSWQNASIFKESVVIPNIDGSLFLFEGSDAGLQRIPVSMQTLVDHSPFVADDGTVYIADKVSKFFVVDSSSGVILATLDALDEADLNAFDSGTNEGKVDWWALLGGKKGGKKGLLIGVQELRVKALDPTSRLPSWRAHVTYFSTVRTIGGPDVDTVWADGGVSGAGDPGLYFYHKTTLYAVDKATGKLIWWQGLTAPALAVLAVGDITTTGSIGEERLLVPTTSALEGLDDLWGSRLLAGEDFQYVQVHEGQPFSVSGVLKPPRSIDSQAETPASQALTASKTSVMKRFLQISHDGADSAVSNEVVPWGGLGNCRVGELGSTFPVCLSGVHSVNLRTYQAKDAEVQAEYLKMTAMARTDDGDHLVDNGDSPFREVVIRSFISSHKLALEAFQAAPYGIEGGEASHDFEDVAGGGTHQESQRKWDAAREGGLWELGAALRERIGEELGKVTFADLYWSVVRFLAQETGSSEFWAQVQFCGYVMIALTTVYFNTLHCLRGPKRLANFEKMGAASARNVANGGELVSKRKGGTRGGKSLRRRKDAIARQEGAARGGVKDGEAGCESESDEDGEGVLTVGRLEVETRRVLGQGSHGTTVFRGRLDGRPVAVKRLLASFFEIALGEIEALISADAHPSVVRYYCREHDGDFVYLALELCKQSLADLIEGGGAEGGRKVAARSYLESFGEGGEQESSARRPLDENRTDGDSAGADDGRGAAQPTGFAMPPEAVKQLLRDLLTGVAYLHSMNIVHRDLKPANVLLTAQGRGKISDMGLCKKLEADQSSFETVSAGTMGWRAPELLLGERCSRFVDMFGLGCICYYALTGGGHVFGPRILRDANIVTSRADASALDHLPEAQHLVLSLVQRQPQRRPTAAAALHHPFFWSEEKSLRFLIDCSDRVEKDELTSINVVAMERHAAAVFASRWDRALDAAFVATLLERRKYNYNSLRDLLRAIRNKKNHYRELPPDVQALMGPMPAGYMSYFRGRFPKLLLELHAYVDEMRFSSEDDFAAYYPPST